MPTAPTPGKVFRVAEDWTVDVKKYAPDADDGVIAAIVRYCGIALRSRDASLVSFSDPAEINLVRENYLKKKLGLTDADSVLDDAIAAVGQRMAGDRTRNRVTVYYLLAEHFHKLGVFAGADSTASAEVAAMPPMATADVARAAFAGSAAAVGGAAAAAVPPPIGVASRAPMGIADAPPVDREPEHREVAAGGIGQWLPIALLVLGGLALLWFLFRKPPTPVTVPAVVATVVAPAETMAVAPAAAPAPAGADVVETTVADEPMVSVYFATAKSDIAPSFAERTAALRAFLAAHPGDHLQVSGYNDPRGDAAMNAKLSKSRAFAVRDALAGLGVAVTSITLVKPVDTTAESGADADSLAQARRVDVTVQDGPVPVASAESGGTNP